MRLFQRTLLFFAAGIAFQGALTTFFLAESLGNIQSNEATRELKAQASSAFDAFNAWKLALWMAVNDLAEDQALSKAVESAEGPPPGDRGTLEAVRAGLAGTPVDSAILKSGASGVSRIVLAAERQLPPPSSSLFGITKDHPYVELVQAGGSLWFSGAVRIGKDRPLDVFLLKRVSPELVSQLSFDPRVQVIVSIDPETAVTGSGGDWRLMEGFIKQRRESPEPRAYELIGNWNWRGEAFGAVVRSSGTVRSSSGEGTVRLGVLLSKAEYRRNLLAVNLNIALITVLAAGLTVGVSLGLSRSISSPIRRLLAAIHRIREGQYSVSVPGSPIDEFDELSSGFNAMASKLEADDREQELYISRIVKSEKLASVGMLSAGVAHEVNNPLSSILSNVQNLIMEESDPGKKEILRMVEDETRRIARIVKDLLEFSAPRQEGAEIRCNPGSVVREALGLISYSLRKEDPIELFVDVSPGCPDAAITEDELKQLVINLVKNSLQAIGGRGIVAVRVGLSRGRVRIDVADSGPGIPPDARSLVFDPFFTTKAQEGGTGLGLSVVYGIVTKRGGSVAALCPEGCGTIMRVELPVTEGAA